MACASFGKLFRLLLRAEFGPIGRRLACTKLIGRGKQAAYFALLCRRQSRSRSWTWPMTPWRQSCARSPARIGTRWALLSISARCHHIVCLQLACHWYTFMDRAGLAGRDSMCRKGFQASRLSALNPCYRTCCGASANPAARQPEDSRDQVNFACLHSRQLCRSARSGAGAITATSTRASCGMPAGRPAAPASSQTCRCPHKPTLIPCHGKYIRSRCSSLCSLSCYAL